jgi:hypothetical protein
MKCTTSYLATGVLAVGGLAVGSASADTYLSDNFETQPITSPVAPGTEMQPPTIGTRWGYTETTQVEAVNIVQAPLPVKGTKSVEAQREGGIQASFYAVSTANTMADNKVLEYKWSHYLAVDPGEHPFNAPMQVSGGYSNGGIGSLFFIAINDKVISGVTQAVYQYSDAYNGDQKSNVIATQNGWDDFRVVLTLDQYDSTYMAGTYDLYVSQNGAPEIQVANDAPNFFALIPTTPNIHNDPTTSALFRVQKGPSPARSYYDNVSIADFGDALLGDFNLDSVVDDIDIDMLAAHLAASGTNSLYDVNGDTLVTTADLDYEVQTILATNYGDTDLDGDVDLSDLSNLAANYSQTPRGWAQGNFDIDTDVDLNDLSNLAAYYGLGEAQAFADFQSIAVPEPASLASVGLAGLAMLARKRRA